MKVEGDCFNWTGYKDKNGYGRILVGSSQVCAHRHVYEVKYGRLPIKMEVHHLCENKSCVRLSHLKAVTKAEHNKLTNFKRTHCKRGHLFTEDSVYENAHGRQCKLCHPKNIHKLVKPKLTTQL